MYMDKSSLKEAMSTEIYSLIIMEFLRKDWNVASPEDSYIIVG